MKRGSLGLIVAMVMTIFAPIGLAVQKPILVTEVQTGSEVSASEEFVEIYNITAQGVDIGGWGLYYKSATGANWAKKATVPVGTILQSDDFFVFAANLPANTQYAGGLSGSGGNIQIRDSSGSVIDQFGWGNGDSALGSSASESAGGQSMYRIYDFGVAVMQNTDDNFNDFNLTNNPTPATFPAQEQPEVDQQVVDYPKLQLNELFPNPASPQTDSVDEFIEIYNPNAFSVDLSGWKLRDESGEEFIIKGKTIEPYSRLAVFVTESKITLNNSGDSMQLVDPNGQVSDESMNYGVAEEGLSWSYISGVWQWAVSATPGAVNSAMYVDTDPSATVASIKKATTKKSAKKASSSKPKTSKVKSSLASSAGSPSLEASESQGQSSPWWSWLLVGLGAVTIGYGIYEYRTEIHFFFKKLGAKLGVGSKAS